MELVRIKCRAELHHLMPVWLPVFVHDESGAPGQDPLSAAIPFAWCTYFVDPVAMHP